MRLTDQTRQIIGFTWARMLGLDDEAFETDEPQTRWQVHDDAAAVSVVRLFGQTVITGPDAALEALSRVEGALRGAEGALRGAAQHGGAGRDDEPVSERRLLELLLPGHPGARALGAARLLYCEEPGAADVADDLAVSFNPADASALTSQCPADDVEASGVGAADWTATLMVDSGAPGHSGSASGPAPVAAASRVIWHHALAHLGVLTHPAQRGSGHGGSIAAVAAEEAFVEGLIPQWRVSVESRALLRIARSLGFHEVGTQTTVLLR